jgi:hypothetical protein
MVSAVTRLVPLALVAALAGCGPHRTVDLSPGPQPVATIAAEPTVTDVPIATATPTDTSHPDLAGDGATTASPAATPAPDGTLTNGKHPVYITSVDVANRKLTVDVVQFFTGDAAANAAREDGASEVRPPNDYWVRNANKMLRTLPVSAAATITVNTLAGETSGDSAKDVAVSLEQLAGYNLANHLFWVTVDGGTITRIAEQFLP